MGRKKRHGAQGKRARAARSEPKPRDNLIEGGQPSPAQPSSWKARGASPCGPAATCLQGKRRYTGNGSRSRGPVTWEPLWPSGFPVCVAQWQRGSLTTARLGTSLLGLNGLGCWFEPWPLLCLHLIEGGQPSPAQPSSWKARGASPCGPAATCLQGKRRYTGNGSRSRGPVTWEPLWPSGFPVCVAQWQRGSLTTARLGTSLLGLNGLGCWFEPWPLLCLHLIEGGQPSPAQPSSWKARGASPCGPAATCLQGKRRYTGNGSRSRGPVTWEPLWPSGFPVCVAQWQRGSLTTARLGTSLLGLNGLGCWFEPWPLLCLHLIEGGQPSPAQPSSWKARGASPCGPAATCLQGKRRYTGNGSRSRGPVTWEPLWPSGFPVCVAQWQRGSLTTARLGTSLLGLNGLGRRFEPGREHL
ncbi:uncharacterized protein PSFLO_02991 [Pseudozyma flocculosa]|uniref:Leucine-rich repeat-containing N-terminal plant-type domain-containing protein n=1 Tax=Pseudozyma flocculosa TaxID=84751 RepID=A0A5C3F0R6_9BASI|nr:uncharacterized protein PSFLO_02991 [Pseudozyma flocculosa]